MKKKWKCEKLDKVKRDRNYIFVNKGITLVALVITIIILLILAGISISILIGENGLITKVAEAKQEHNEAEIREKVELMLEDYQVEKIRNEEIKLLDYFSQKKDEGEIDDVSENQDGYIEIMLNGYIIIINNDDSTIIDIQETDEYAIGIYEVTGYNAEEDMIKILITIKSDTNITKIICPNGKTETYSNGEKEIGIDYEVIDGEQYKFIVETNGTKKIYTVQTKGTTVGKKINSKEALQEVSKLTNVGYSYENKTVTLGREIDLKGNENNQWIPIGTSTNPFKGTFDGKDSSIKNIYIDTTSSYQGLFGVIKNGSVENLSLTGNIVSGSYCGGVVGYGENITITKCSSEIDITTNDNFTGGIIGYMTGTSIIKRCVNNKNITGKFRVGGIVGMTQYVTNSSITECVNNGNVKATSYWMDNGIPLSAVGGIVGNAWPDSTTYNINYCYNSGTISGPGGLIGGILGFTQSRFGGPNVLYCYSYGSISGGNRTGGIVGYQWDGSISVSNCYYLNGSATVSSGSLTNFGTALSDDNLKSLVDNDVWKDFFTSDSVGKPINKGYPILKWQVEE